LLDERPPSGDGYPVRTIASINRSKRPSGDPV
jgi:hypothetical protein